MNNRILLGTLIVLFTISLCSTTSIIQTNEYVKESLIKENEYCNTLKPVDYYHLENDGTGVLKMVVENVTYTIDPKLYQWTLLFCCDKIYHCITELHAVGGFDTEGFESTSSTLEWKFTYNHGEWHWDNDTKSQHRSGIVTSTAYAYDPDGNLAYYNSHYSTKTLPKFDVNSTVKILCTGAYWDMSYFSKNVTISDLINNDNTYATYFGKNETIPKSALLEVNVEEKNDLFILDVDKILFENNVAEPIDADVSSMGILGPTYYTQSYNKTVSLIQNTTGILSLICTVISLGMCFYLLSCCKFD